TSSLSVSEVSAHDPIADLASKLADSRAALGLENGDAATMTAEVERALAELDAQLARTPDDPLLLAARQNLVEAAAYLPLDDAAAPSAGAPSALISAPRPASVIESAFAPAALTATTSIAMDPPGTFAGPISFEQ